MSIPRAAVWTSAFLLWTILASPVRAQCPTWTPDFGFPGVDDWVEASAVFDDGSGPALYLGGSFTMAGGVAAAHVVKWDGHRFSPLADGIEGRVECFLVHDDGSGPALYAGGAIAGGIQRWNGTAWRRVGSGLSFSVLALAVHDDGTGPALYAGGSAWNEGGLARWDGSSWSSLGEGMQNPIGGGWVTAYSLASFDDGSGPALYVGGRFTGVDGVAANNLARWNGAAWSALGNGSSAAAGTFIVFDVGNGPALFATSSFGPNGESCMARWTGSGWTPIAPVSRYGGARASAIFDDGSGPALFLSMPVRIGAEWANDIVRWDGSTLTPLGAGAYCGTLAASADAGGRALFAGGGFTSIGGASAGRIARWESGVWSALGPDPGVGGANNEVYALSTLEDGVGPALYVGGYFDRVGETPAVGLARWDGAAWSTVGGGLDGPVTALAGHVDAAGPSLYAAGHFTHAGGVAVGRIARFDGASWSPLGSGLLGGGIHALEVFDDGSGPDLYAGGSFWSAGGVSVEGIAKYDGSAWSDLGGGVVNGYLVSCLAVFDDGTGPALYAGGEFYNIGIGSTGTHNIAKWDGTSWSSVGWGTDGPVHSLVAFDDGTGAALYAGGWFVHAGSVETGGVARWDGTSWSALGTPVTLGSPDRIDSLAVFDDGSGPALHAGGWFVGPASGISLSYIGKWDGTRWLRMGAGVNSYVHALAVFDYGAGPDLYAGGAFTTAGRVGASRLARWRGCSSPGALFCAGSSDTCPCSNGGHAWHGCENSAAPGGAQLTASGTVHPDTVVLHAAEEPDAALSLFLQGDTSLASGLPFGDGLRCLGGNLRRLYVRAAQGGEVSAPAPGELSIRRRSAALGDVIAPGSTRYYQVDYREPNAAFCTPPSGASWNTTNGVVLDW